MFGITRNPLKKMQTLRDNAERLGLTYLESHAVKGTITKAMVFEVAKALNYHPQELVEMIPDRRRATRHEKAMAGLRAVSLINERQIANRFED